MDEKIINKSMLVYINLLLVSLDDNLKLDLLKFTHCYGK